MLVYNWLWLVVKLIADWSVGYVQVTRRAVTFVFNPVSGQRVEGTPVSGHELDYKVTQVVKLELMDEHFMHPLVLLDDQQKVHVIPATAEAVVADTASSLYLFTTDVDSGLLRGYGLRKAQVRQSLCSSVLVIS